MGNRLKAYRIWANRLFILSLIVFGIRLFLFFLAQHTTLNIDPFEKVTIYSNALIGLVIFLIYIWPKQLGWIEWAKSYSFHLLLSFLITFYDGLFFIRIQSHFNIFKLFSTIGICALFLAILYLIPRRIRLGTIVCLLILLPVYYVAQDIYFGIFDRYFSFKELVTLREGVESSEGMIRFSGFHYIYFSSMILSLFLFFFIKRKLKPPLLHYQLTWSRLKQTFAPALILLVIVNINASIPRKTARLHQSDHYLYFRVFDNTSFVNRFGVAHFFLRDIADILVPERGNPKDYEAIEEYFAKYPKLHEGNGYTGLFEGKNLVFIVAESFDEMALDDQLTPNIMRLKKEGISFDNHFVPVYPRTTCDTEFIYNTGLIPSIKDGPTCYMFNGNSYSQSLPMLFKKKGYLAQAFHNNYKEFYTRHLVYKGLGYDALYGQHELGLSEEDIRYDSLFFEKGKDRILPDQTPFMSFVLTLSGHSPYETTNLAVKAHLSRVKAHFNGQAMDEDILKYIAPQIEVDLLVGKLLEELEERGLLEDTVIIFTTDHYPYTLNKKAYEKYRGVEEGYLKMKGPLIIWGSGVEPQSIQRLTSSFDVLPTVANLFNLDINYTYYVGHDVFDRHHQELVLFKDYAWFDGQNYVKDGHLKAGSMTREEVERMSERVNLIYEINRKILQVNYFKLKE